MTRPQPYGKRLRTGISLLPEVMTAVDNAKGNYSRSALINDILWQVLIATDEQLESMSSYDKYEHNENCDHTGY
jgi:hypothetical protein